MKIRRLYFYTTTIALGIIMITIMVGMLVPIILYPKEAWFLIIGIFLLLLAFWYMVGTGQFTPIYLSEKGIN